MQGRTDRYFDGEPLVPFGHGLSDTKFEYSGIEIDRRRAGAGDTVNVSVSVKNVGRVSGDEVVQLYAHETAPREPRARKELRGVQRVTLAPGEARRVSFALVPRRDLTHYDVERKAYAVDAGDYELEIGASSADIRQRASLAVSAD
jgi:beta-glucosidase